MDAVWWDAFFELELGFYSKFHYPVAASYSPIQKLEVLLLTSVLI